MILIGPSATTSIIFESLIRNYQHPLSPAVSNLSLWDVKFDKKCSMPEKTPDDSLVPKMVFSWYPKQSPPVRHIHDHMAINGRQEGVIQSIR